MFQTLNIFWGNDKKKKSGHLNRVNIYQWIFNVLNQFLCYHCVEKDVLSMLKCNSGQKGIFINYTIPPNLQVRLSCLWCSIRRQFLFKNVDIQWAASSPQSRAETLNILMKDYEIFTIVFIMPLFNVILSYSTISGFLHVPISTDFGLTQNGLASHRLILWWWMQL